MDMQTRNRGIIAFPKATRTSRARAESQQRANDANDCSENMHFFELLASVAGQLLEEEQKDGKTGGISCSTLSPSMSSKESVGEKDATYKLLPSMLNVKRNYTEKKCIHGAGNSRNGLSMPDIEGESGEITMSYYVDQVVGSKQTCCALNDANEHGEEENDMHNDSRPPLVSSSSEGEPMDKESDVPVNTNGPKHQDFLCSKVIDEDRISSESAVFKTAQSTLSRMSKEPKLLSCAKVVAMKTRNSSSSVKRKHSSLNGERDPVIRRSESTNMHQKQTRKKMELDIFPVLAADDKYGSRSSTSKLHKVKLNIKSFLVPELSIDLPESATVANLKRAVMEAAVNLLGSHLGVRVLLNDEKILDETITLVQAGIVSNEHSGSLSFMLEPTSIDQAITWYPGLSSKDEGNTNDVPSVQDCQVVEKEVADNKEDGCESNEAVMAGSCTLTTSQVADALAVVPFDENAGSLHVSKRRARRPFSVAEVEALVQAVEKLGTGRWRDVKLHAFGEAEHRTYVDLKDKWKTLVHTASIAPHQRRGEPVPQQLLDRVTNAHAYWTEHQAVKAADC